MISFIDEHRGVFWVEPICRLLPTAPSTYYEVVAKRTDVGRLSARARRDIAMKIKIRRVFNGNFQVYRVRKVWRQLQREGFDIAHCTVARLMRAMALQGIIRGEAVEFATLEWVDWFNNRRLLEPIGNIPPAEAEERYYAMLDAPAMAA